MLSDELRTVPYVTHLLCLAHRSVRPYLVTYKYSKNNCCHFVAKDGIRCKNLVNVIELGIFFRARIKLLNGVSHFIPFKTNRYHCHNIVNYIRFYCQFLSNFLTGSPLYNWNTS